MSRSATRVRGHAIARTHRSVLRHGRSEVLAQLFNFCIAEICHGPPEAVCSCFRPQRQCNARHCAFLARWWGEKAKDDTNRLKSALDDHRRARITCWSPLTLTFTRDLVPLPTHPLLYTTTLHPVVTPPPPATRHVAPICRRCRAATTASRAAGTSRPVYEGVESRACIYTDQVQLRLGSRQESEQRGHGRRGGSFDR